jgi:putative membrane protein insertion efficiency factor
MPALQQQAASKSGSMPPLRKRLTDPRLWLGLALIGIAALCCDVLRRPDRQVTADLYVRAVRWYQRNLSPVAARRIRCRYQPTCSQYSIDAVERFGIGKGLALTVGRLRRCQPGVPPGTNDPVLRSPAIAEHASGFI